MMTKQNTVTTLAVALWALMVAQGACGADEWGSLKGTFRYDGDPPKPVPIAVDLEPELRGEHELVDESLVVDPMSKGIRNVIVYLYQERTARKAPPIHPALLDANKAKATLSIANCRFDPHVVTVLADEVVNFRNADPIAYAAKVNTMKAAPIAPFIPAEADVDQRFTTAEYLPVQVNCPGHPWMSGYIVVKDHPYVAVTGAGGSFEINNLPAGKWTFQVWQEKSGYIAKVTIDGKEQKWAKGRVDVIIEPNKSTDLGEVMVATSNFRK